MEGYNITYWREGLRKTTRDFSQYNR